MVSCPVGWYFVVSGLKMGCWSSTSLELTEMLGRCGSEGTEEREERDTDEPSCDHASFPS